MLSKNKTAPLLNHLWKFKFFFKANIRQNWEAIEFAICCPVLSFIFAFSLYARDWNLLFSSCVYQIWKDSDLVIYTFNPYSTSQTIEVILMLFIWFSTLELWTTGWQNRPECNRIILNWKILKEKAQKGIVLAGESENIPVFFTVKQILLQVEISSLTQYLQRVNWQKW